jgi:aspartyl-tRNA(Asn)/glutamyl-tRNA(Gln) amidotransferase subunit C
MFCDARRNDDFARYPLFHRPALVAFENSAMALTLQDVTRAAHLARIEISSDEAQATLAKLTGVFDLIGQMQAIDTTGIEPMAHGFDVAQRLRPDVVTHVDQRTAFQQSAPAVERGLYLVPKVIE